MKTISTIFLFIIIFTTNIFAKIPSYFCEMVLRGDNIGTLATFDIKEKMNINTSPDNLGIMVPAGDSSKPVAIPFTSKKSIEGGKTSYFAEQEVARIMLYVDANKKPLGYMVQAGNNEPIIISLKNCTLFKE